MPPSRERHFEQVLNCDGTSHEVRTVNPEEARRDQA